jgi:hypothetical protein
MPKDLVGRALSTTRGLNRPKNPLPKTAEMASYADYEKPPQIAKKYRLNSR